MSSTAATCDVVPPWYRAGEWLLVSGLALVFVWTTLCLGGYMAHALVPTAWGLAMLSGLAGALWLARPQPVNWSVWLPVPFLCFALASVVWLAPARWLAWREWLLWLQMWLVFAVVLHFGRTARHAWVWVITFGGLGLTGVVMAAYQRYGDPSWMMLGRTQAAQFAGRSAGMFGIPNSLAGLLELMLPVTLTVLGARSTSVVGRVFCGWLAVLFLFALVLTGSRGGWLAFGGVLILWPLLSGRAWRRKLVGAALALVTAVAAGTALYSFSTEARARIDPFIEGKFETSRPIIWRSGWQIWEDHRWFGSGTASYNVVFDQYRAEGFNNEPDWTHNDYLNTLSDYGVVGFTLWLGAGLMLLGLGWRRVQRARLDPGEATEWFARWKWRLGLFLGLVAYALHLAVDFHTKIPALAFAAAIVMGLLLRDDPGLRAEASSGGRWILAGLVGVVAPVCLLGLAVPLYTAEGMRFIARRDIDRYAARGVGDRQQLIPAGLVAFSRAVEIYPAHGQAWADLAYATVQSWHLQPGQNLKEVGARAERAADRAIALCAINAEYWVRKGVALDMQARREEAEHCFRRAVELAPHSPAWHYHYAYHLSVRAGRLEEARRSLATCLALDPAFSAGVALHQQLTVRR